MARGPITRDFAIPKGIVKLASQIQLRSSIARMSAMADGSGGETALRGRRTQKVVPSLSDDETAIEPPCERAISRAMKSPSPSPAPRGRDAWVVRPSRKERENDG